MRHKRSYPTPEISPLVPVMAGALAVAIFLVDALTSLDMAVAVLYVVVVLLAANFLDRRGLLLVSAGCAVLTVLAYLLAHGLTTSTAFGRFLMSLAAIGITAFLALRNQSASMGLREQVRLPDLTHDTIFVRDMNDVITYWNRGAEDLYGWKREQAVGKASHQLTQTIFPAPLEEITAELLRTGRWEGELVHTKGDGTQVVVASRWSLQQDERGRPVAIMETNTNITERKEAEERLRKAERELRLTIDTIPAMVVSAWPDGTVDFINARWIEQGFSEDDLRAGLAALVHPDDLAEFAERRSRSIASGEPYQAEVRLKKANGEFRWYLAQAVTLRDETGRVVKRYSTATDIEDHKRAEESLRRAESELRTTIDSIPAMVLSTWPDGTMDFINARFAEEGFSEQDLLSDWSSLFHPEDLPELMERRQRSLAAGGSYEAEARVRRIDGEYRWFLLRALGLRDQTGRVIKRYVTATDIEDRKRAEDALRRSETLLAETQALSRTGSIGFDPATGEGFWSAEGARILGYHPSTEPALSLVLQRVHPDDVWLAQRSIDRANWGEPDTEFDIRLLMPDGAVKYVHVVPHVGRDASAGRVLRALIDVTAAREAEAALSKAQTELAHVARMTMLGELAASIAHEVNQPLAAIVTNGQACLRWLDREVPHLTEARAAVQRIAADADRAGEMIRRILALSKKSEPQKAPLDLNEVINEAISLIRRELSRHDVTLQLDLAPDLPMVLADRVQIQQVIINLLINAIQAMAPVTDRRRILLARSRVDEAGRVLVAVRDSGPGIDPKSRSRLFETFFTTKPDGVGLGLSICRSIIEAHRGEVWASTHDSPGTTFEFTVPSIRERAS